MNTLRPTLRISMLLVLSVAAGCSDNDDPGSEDASPAMDASQDDAGPDAADASRDDAGEIVHGQRSVLHRSQRHC